MDLSTLGPTFGILWALIERACLVLVAFSILFHIVYFKRMLNSKHSIVDQLVIAAVFGLFAVYGTLSGVQTTGAIANIRNFGPMMGGLLGGPWAGLVAGLIGGLHRYFVYGGFTAIPCALGTILSGLIGGLLMLLWKGKIGIWKPTIFAFLMEVADMGMILLLAQPFDKALTLVRIISMPMILADTFGVAIFAFLVRDMKEDHPAES